YLGVPSVDTATAVRLLLEAARHASSRLAAEEACRHYARALELLPSDQPGERMSLLLALGPEQRRAGQLEAARKTLRTARTLARRAEDPVAFAHAALGLHALGDSLDAGRGPIDLVDEAYAWLCAAGPADAAVRARL